MSKVYVTRCIVKKDGKSYKKGSVIKTLTAEEIKRGLAENWLEAIGNDDDSDESGSGDKPEGVSKRDKLLLKAKEFGIEVKDEMTNGEIQQLLKEAKA